MLAQRIRAADPNGQIGWRILLEARIASNDSIGARAEADHFEEWLRHEEWDLEPASRAALVMARHQLKSEVAPLETGTLVAELVGREREFATIHASWIQAQAKGARFIHINAESGIGKTRLVSDFAVRLRAARENVIYQKANPGERSIPFAFAAAIAERLSAVTGASGISPAAAGVLVQLNPSLSATYRNAVAPLGRIEALATGLALLEMFSAIAEEEPYALILDDMHWCDSSSRDALAVVASRLGSQTVLVVTTSRPGYSMGFLGENHVELRLQALSSADVQHFLGSLAKLPDALWAHEFPVRLHAGSGGNPLYILEGLRLCMDAGLLVRNAETWSCTDAESLFSALEKTSLISQRLASLSMSEREVMRLIAVGGMPFPPRIVAEASGGNMEGVRAIAANLELRGLLTAHEEMWSLAHDAIAGAVIAQASQNELNEAHARLGRAMASRTEWIWKKRAVRHLTESESWKEAAQIAASFFRENHFRGQSAFESIAGLLGAETPIASQRRLFSELPLRLRYPNLIPLGAALAIVVLGGIGILSGRRWQHHEITQDSELFISSPTSSGAVQLQVVHLTDEGWDSRNPIIMGGAAGPTGFGSDNEHLVPKPGAMSWAIYTVFADSGQGDITLVDSVGKQHRLTSSRGEDRPEAFSPDGKQLLFLTTRWSSNGWSDLALLELGSHSVRRLTKGVTTNQDARWSPDGSRIAFQRGFWGSRGREICTIDTDGSHEWCRKNPHWRVHSIAGWVNATQILVSADSADSRERWMFLDVDRMAFAESTFPDGSVLKLDPSGKWVLVTYYGANREPFTLRISPVTNFHRSRLVVGGSLAAYARSRFASPNLNPIYIDSIAVMGPTHVLQIGVPHQLRVTGFSIQQREIPILNPRWETLTPDIATIDSLGVLLGLRTGTAIIRVSAGGWRSVTQQMPVRSAATKLLLSEQWTDAPLLRWQTFGEPKPIFERTENRTVLNNNGDDNFFSGAYLRRDYPAQSGIALDFDVTTPITRTQWQTLLVGLDAPRDSSQLNKWDQLTGYIAPFLDDASSGCWFAYPNGEGPEAVTNPDWFKSLRIAMNNSEYRLDTGKWYHVRLQIFPDGRCGLAINNRALRITPRVWLMDRRVRPIIEGSSVGTRILIGEVRVQEGVPDDIDWRHLHFLGSIWFLASRTRR